MQLKNLTILNYKNLAEVQLELSPKVNCFIGQNGAGKTNVLDAVYFLSFCRSMSNPVDSAVIRHDENLCALDATYVDEDGTEERISCGLKRGVKKTLKRNGKPYKRLSEHIGLVPLVIVSPSDTWLISGDSTERRLFMDICISQFNRPYMETLSRYNKALQQRNTLLKMEEEPDPMLMQLWEEQMAMAGEEIYKQRAAFTEALTPVFNKYYRYISNENEEASLIYVSHCQRGPLLDVIQRDRHKDRAVGYSLHGVHRDNLEMQLSGYPIRREGSQGQTKTFVIALKLAQFEFLCHTGRQTKPLLLLDDIFDKLDASRVEKIVNLVSGNDFGQIFITDTNRKHLDDILAGIDHDHRIFHVENGEIESPSAALPREGEELNG